MRKTKSIVFVALLTFGFVFASLPVAFASPHTDISVGTAWSMIIDANNSTKAYDMSGGIEGWIAAGYPIMKGVLQGSYRDWKVVLNAGRIYLISPQTVAGASLIYQVGMWDAEDYGNLGKTVVDAAKPAIDECISGC